MNKYALLTGNTVTNVIMTDGEWPEGIDITNATPQPQIGWTYSGGTFAAPPPPAPVLQTFTARADIYSRLTNIEVHLWRRAVVRAEATDNPQAKDRDALYAWYRFNALPDRVDLTSAEITGLKAVWMALGMTAARADAVLAPVTV